MQVGTKSMVFVFFPAKISIPDKEATLFFYEGATAKSIILICNKTKSSSANTIRGITGWAGGSKGSLVVFPGGTKCDVRSVRTWRVAHGYCTTLG